MPSFTEKVVMELGRCVLAEFISKSRKTKRTTAVWKALQRVCKRHSTAARPLRCFARVQGHNELSVDGLCWEEGQGAAVAINSEWGRDWRSILEGFEKLLMIKAALKVMMFQTSGKSMVARREADAIRAKMLEYMHDKYTHHVSGEMYVFVEFYGRDERGEYGFAAYQYTVPANGQLKEIPAARLLSFADADWI